MDTPSALGRFQELLRIPTVSHADEADTDWGQFERFRDRLGELYPLVHRHLEREVIAGHSLLLRWAGRSPGEVTVLMAHQDVVAVVPAEWEHDPFAAVVTGSGDHETVFARGSIDDKGALVAILEAVESLLEADFQPEHDVYLAFGHDEETTGSGARAIAQTLRDRGVRARLVLDEGGAVVDGVFPTVTVPTAMIGVSERGVMTLRLTATEAGGHASTPPPMPATTMLARTIMRLHRNPFPTRLAPPVRAMLATIAPYADEPLRSMFANTALTGPLVARALSVLGPEMNATVRTTAAVTELSGSPGHNVLAATARAWVNIRLLHGDTVDGVTERVRRIVDDPNVRVELEYGSDPAPVSSWRGPEWSRIARAVRAELGQDIVPTPYLQLGASDSRWFTTISGNVYRFTPFHLARSERDALHAHNERIRVAVWLRGIAFYREFMRSS